MNLELRDYKDLEAIGVQISEDGNRIWVCVNGTCVLRAKGIQNIEINDMREKRSTGRN